jgi:hypothetical protein
VTESLPIERMILIYDQSNLGHANRSNQMLQVAVCSSLGELISIFDGLERSTFHNEGRVHCKPSKTTFGEGAFGARESDFSTVLRVTSPRQHQFTRSVWTVSARDVHRAS